jgi:hypothetical protein
MDLRKLLLEERRVLPAHARYSRFETLALKLLNKHLEYQQKPFSAHVRITGRQLDGVAPQGIDDLPGPTVVEVKLSLTPKNIRNVLDQLYASARQRDFPSALLVVGEPLTAHERRRVEEVAAEWLPHVKLRLWDLDDLAPLLQEYAEYVLNVVPEIDEVAVSNVVKKSLRTSSEEWKETRKRYVEELGEAFAKDELVLFLGAGVSQSAGVPSWTSLLSKLFLAMVEKLLPQELAVLPVEDHEKRFVAAKLQELQESLPLVAARYLNSGLGDSFEEALSGALYEGIKEGNGGTSSLLEAVAHLCVPRRNGLGVRAVVTYNFDDLVENHLGRSRIEHKPIYRDVDVTLPHELGVYHVHGFLPREVQRYDGVSDSLLVFSEESYHTLLADPFSWSNIVQVNFFREATCLLTGLSVTDPNLRRLLDTAARRSESPRHYVFLKRLSVEMSQEESGHNSVPVRPKVVQEFVSVHHGLVEKEYLRLGLNVIWVEDYDEIPSILHAVRR